MRIEEEIMDVSVRRSLLIVPAGRQRPVDKAPGLPADVVMYDLDDGVVFSGDEKEAARARVVDAVAAKRGPQQVVVRTNATDTPWWREDVVAAAGAGVDAVVPAKIRNAEDVRMIEDAIDDASRTTDIWPMIETPGAVLRCEQIAAASERIKVLLFGVGDYTAETQGEFADSIDHLAYPLGKLICTARDQGIAAMAPAVVFSDMGKLHVIRSQALYLRKLGFDGAMVMYPGHLETVNEVFTPTPDEVRWAQRVDAEMRKAEETGQSSVVLDGKLVEIVNLTAARKVLAKAEILGLV
jgi:citrate lyase subunit beta/citryl-CoA lyase